MDNHDTEISDDGLTQEERNILQTPVCKIAPEQRHILVALRDKKADFIYAENDKYRREEAEKNATRFA